MVWKGTDEFVVFDVEEDEFRPEMCFLSGFDDLGDIDARDEELEMFHDCTCVRTDNDIAKPIYARLAGLYLLSRMESSVKIPMCARSKLNPASKRLMISSK